MRRETTAWRALLGALALALGLGLPGRADEQPLHDPLAEAAPGLDATAREVLDAFPGYEVERLWAAVRALEARAGKAEAGPHDGWILAQGYLELLVAQRHFERHQPDDVPQLLRDHPAAELAERGIAAATAFRDAHPDHSDVERVLGELTSFQITGPISGWSKGPQAREAVERAKARDPGNAWAHFAEGRMLFHNPAMAGGDKDKALEVFRLVVRSLAGFRAPLYLAMTYQAKGMLRQARYWAEVARRAAPDNPEVAWLARELRGTEDR